MTVKPWASDGSLESGNVGPLPPPRHMQSSSRPLHRAWIEAFWRGLRHGWDPRYMYSLLSMEMPDRQIHLRDTDDSTHTLHDRIALLISEQTPHERNKLRPWPRPGTPGSIGCGTDEGYKNLHPASKRWGSASDVTTSKSPVLVALRAVPPRFAD